MSNEHMVRDALHEATHRIPGVPAHTDHPRGHQEPARHGRSFQNRDAGMRHTVRTHNTTPPHVMVSWQNWIAGLLARKAR